MKRMSCAWLAAGALSLATGCSANGRPQQHDDTGTGGIVAGSGGAGAIGTGGVASVAGTGGAGAGGAGDQAAAGAGGQGGSGGATSNENLMLAPPLLSQTGLFSEMASQALGVDVQSYEPKYALWSDGADKRRWLKLPAGAQIDSSDMDNWRYPIGTKIWKEFAKDGKLLETRYMAKYGADGMDWTFMAYQWDAAGTDATAVPEGAKNVAGTQHDIPSDLTCLKCHEGLPDAALGVSALQLSHAGPGATLATLTADGKLSHAAATPLAIPGDAVAEKALGYLHANCGSCHNPNGGEAFNKNESLIFWQSASKLTAVEATTTYVNLVTNTNGNLDLLRKSLERMQSRPEKQMPPVASELVDDQGVAALAAWLEQLEARFPQAAFTDGGMP